MTSIQIGEQSLNLSGYDNIETDRGSPPGIPRLLSMIANPENINDNPRLYTTSIQELSASFTNYHKDLTGKTGSPINNVNDELREELGGWRYSVELRRVVHVKNM